MSFGTRAYPIVLQDVAFGAIAAGYLAIGAAFAQPMRILKFKNYSNQDILLSYDGVNDHEFMPAETGDVIDFSSNEVSSESPMVSKGTVIYIKHNGVAPTTGGFALSGYFCIGD